MKQSNYSIGCAQGKLRAIAGDHFIALSIKVKKSDIAALLDENQVLKAGTLLTKDGKPISTTGTPLSSNAYGIVYEDVSFKGSMSPDATPGNATEPVSLFVHGVVYEAEVKFTSAANKGAEISALKQILFV